MNPVYLERARSGIYQRSSLREVPEELRTLHFELQKGHSLYAVRPFLKQDIQWKNHNLLSDPPETGFHLIFLRNNLLTYYKDSLKMPAFRKVSCSIVPGGFLIIGAHEKLPPETTNLSPFSGHSHIFRNRDLIK